MIELQSGSEGETMQATLDERVDALERQVGALSEIVKKKSAQDWRSAFGAFRDDEGFEEMVRLGEEIRQKDREEAGAGADSRH
jgi:hypothetical protein